MPIQNPESKIQNPKGGSFLIETRSPGEVFTPEDMTDQHKLIAQTAHEFVSQEIVPRAKEMEEKKPGLLRELLKKAADVGLSATDIPQRFGGLELDRISSVIVAEKMARNGSWAATVGAAAKGIEVEDQPAAQGPDGHDVPDSRLADETGDEVGVRGRVGDEFPFAVPPESADGKAAAIAVGAGGLHLHAPHPRTRINQDVVAFVVAERLGDGESSTGSLEHKIQLGQIAEVFCVVCWRAPSVGC
jgi:hypothetical protein